MRVCYTYGISKNVQQLACMKSCSVCGGRESRDWIVVFLFAKEMTGTLSEKKSSNEHKYIARMNACMFAQRGSLLD